MSNFKQSKVEPIEKDQAILATLQLHRDGKFWKSFEIVHNVDSYGQDIQHALDSWIARTKNFTDVSFCEYVLSKFDDECICMPKKRFDKICKKAGYKPGIEKHLNKSN